ncbi:DNA recombination protein RmuC [Actinomyces massiliensis]|jgi:rmuC family protein|uniref:RmuC domain protein n=1 Tax=Actinomyces massiliensis F0489 TaxID=1125718 RepID=J1HKT6_9ACTO|nr:DNA recombination protein RmuC [Actinomyces massiliensis]EJF46580.1 RmuC domain protein [Actinomyces massiliensis F0489]WLD71196.1 DNA recombination protein RmuC [Actinomyces massiliensis]
MTTIALPLLFLLIGVGLGAALGYFAALTRTAHRQTAGEDGASMLRAEAAQWRARAEELSERAELAEERAERDGSVLRALAPVRAQLEQMGSRVESVGSRVEAMERQRAAQHATLTEQLRVNAEADRELRRATTTLEGALRSRSARGVWGEVELARVLEISGMMPHVDFVEQRTVGAVIGRRAGAAPSRDAARGRPDVVIHLPGSGHLALDAKVPLDSYLTAASIGQTDEDADGTDDSRRHKLLVAHARALRGHVDALAERHYDKHLNDSPELVVLFIPAEPILAAALDADPGLLEHSLGRGVALTTPSSLLALLRTCATAWARTAVNDDARELLALGRTLYERLGTVAGHLDSLGTALSRSVTAYNRAVGSMESRLLVTARSFTTLGEGLASPAPIEPDAAQVRQFTSAEVASAAPQAAEPPTSAESREKPAGYGTITDF